MSPGLDNKGKSVRKNDRLISNELKLSAAIRSSDSSSLVRYQKTAGSKSTTNNDALLTSKWLERKKLDELGIKYKKGIYTMEEDEVLYAALNKYKILIYGTTPAEHKGFWREIVAIHGKDWTTIGSELGRMGTQCRDRWRDYGSISNRNPRKGEWTKEEEDQLKLIVTDIVTRYKDEITLDYGIPWDIVSERMGKKRSPKQCREKWGRKLRLIYEMEKGGEISKWCSEDSYILQKEEYSFNWESLNDDEWGPWTQVYLHERWRRLKYTIQDFSSKTFTEIVCELYNRFQKSPPQRKYKSPEIIEDSDDELGIVNE
ncbi:6876_t:CDS:10 [Entrophospora sp. SA101]|nr:6876_t:CDS:10 [Entrophospora sp. SA101]